MNSIDHAQKLHDLLVCPVEYEPLLQAVCLIPCAHRVQQAVAERLFGLVYDGWQVMSNKNCPVCKQLVDGYVRDERMRNIVPKLAISSPEMVKTLADIEKNKLPTQCIAVEMPKLVPMPYPGKGAKFQFNGGQKLNARWWMEFISTIETSLIQKFSLHYNDTLSIRIEFSRDNKSFIEYLKRFGLFLDFSAILSGSYHTKTNEQLKTMFTILAENNEIPPSYFGSMRESIVKWLIDETPRASLSMLKEEIEKMPKMSLTVEKPIVEPFPYPGKTAKFQLENEWNLPYPNITFKSFTEDSLIKNFSFIKHHENYVRITICFSPDNKPFIEYLRSFNIILDSVEKMTGTYSTKTNEQARALFKVLEQNNEIPASHIEQIRQYIEQAKF